MIKPFKIVEIRNEPDGTTGVLYEVWKVTALTSKRTQTQRLSSYMTVPNAQNIEAFVFEQLSKAGWF